MAAAPAAAPAAPTAHLKVVVLGEGRVGKTSLLVRYTRDTFDAAQEPTAAASFVEKRVHLDGRTCRVNLWDTAGQERFHALGPLYYRDADAALVVFDVTDAGTLDKARLWVRELRAMVEERIPIALAGNKSDLEHERAVSAEAAQAVADELGAPLFWTSALANRNVDAVFVHLTRAALERERAKERERAQAQAQSQSQARRGTGDGGRGGGGGNDQPRPLVISESSGPGRPAGGGADAGCCGG